MKWKNYKKSPSPDKSKFLSVDSDAICKICGANSEHLFNAKILEKYEVSFFRCPCCDFIQTENPYWLNEAYTKAIANSDLGYVTRNLMYRTISSSVIRKKFNKKAKFLDYGGGYGLFVRLMRDIGFDFYRQDAYCENIFAQYFDINDISDQNKNAFELVTAFEVFEHLVEPVQEIRQMLAYSDSILFSTDLQPTHIESPEDWWYFSLNTGQHIAFYSKKTLQVIANELNLNFYTDGKNFHLLTSKKINKNYIKIVSYYFRILHMILGRYFNNKQSLIRQDVIYVNKKINTFYESK